MYDLIARTASIILVALMLGVLVLGWLPLFFYLIAVVFFLMMVIEWASQHQRAE